MLKNDHLYKSQIAENSGEKLTLLHTWGQSIF